MPKKTGEGYTKKNNNEIIDGPWKNADEIAKQLGIDNGQQLNSFELTVRCNKEKLYKRSTTTSDKRLCTKQPSTRYW